MEPPPLKNASFFSNKKKCLDFSETKEYAKIFCDIFARVSYNLCSKYFLRNFPLEPKVFTSSSESSISGFSCFKNIHRHVYIYTFKKKKHA